MLCVVVGVWACAVYYGVEAVADLAVEGAWTGWFGVASGAASEVYAAVASAGAGEAFDCVGVGGDSEGTWREVWVGWTVY